MTKRLYLLPVVTAVALALGGCQEKEETVVTPTPAPVVAPPAPAASVAEGDRDSAMKAASSGIAEVEASRAISEKTTNAAVREFAQMMIQDHSAANDELKRIAQSKNISLPVAPLPP